MQMSASEEEAWKLYPDDQVLISENGPIKIDEVVTCCARLRGNDCIALPGSKAQLASTGLNIQPVFS